MRLVCSASAGANQPAAFCRNGLDQLSLLRASLPANPSARWYNCCAQDQTWQPPRQRMSFVNEELPLSALSHSARAATMAGIVARLNPTHLWPSDFMRFVSHPKALLDAKNCCEMLSQFRGSAVVRRRRIRSRSLRDKGLRARTVLRVKKRR